MSRLDSFIRRMQAQRACLDWAAAAVAGRPGPVLELGLGNGRTYDHLRERLPGRPIYVFDRQIRAHPDCVPPADRLLIGEIVEMLPVLGRRIGPSAVLAHVDVGSGDAGANAALAARIAPLLDALLAPGAIVVADQAMPVAGWDALPLPPGVEEGRYNLYRAGAAAARSAG